jgi:hypothetical protein
MLPSVSRRDRRVPHPLRRRGAGESLLDLDSGVSGIVQAAMQILLQAMAQQIADRLQVPMDHPSFVRR